MFQSIVSNSVVAGMNPNAFAQLARPIQTLGVTLPSSIETLHNVYPFRTPAIGLPCISSTNNAGVPFSNMLKRWQGSYDDDLKCATTTAAALFDSTTSIPGILKQLKSLLEIDQLSADNRDISSIANSIALMRLASSGETQQVDYYHRATELIENSMNNQSADSPHRFSTHLLKVELSAKTADFYHRAGNQVERSKSLKQLRSSLDLLISNFHDDQTVQKELGYFVADTARLFARMGIWKSALDIVRDVMDGTQFPLLSQNKQITDLLSDPLFTEFVHEDGDRFMTVRELRNNGHRPDWRARFQQAIHMSASKVRLSFKEAAVTGGVGAIVGGVSAGYFLGANPIQSIATASLSAGIALSLRRMHHGMKTEEALETGQIGRANDDAHTKTDLLTVLFRGLKDAGLWAIPVSFVRYSPDGANIIGESLVNAFNNYRRVFPMLLGQISGSYDPLIPIQDASSTWWDIALNTMRDNFFYKGYLGAAGLAYGSYFFAKGNLKDFLKKVAPYLLPGAMLLGVESGLAISSMGIQDKLAQLSEADLSKLKGFLELASTSKDPMQVPESLSNMLNTIGLSMDELSRLINGIDFPAYLDRLKMAGVSIIEAVAMMSVSGFISMSHDSNDPNTNKNMIIKWAKKVLQFSTAFGSSLRRIDANILIAMTLMVGFSSPLGRLIKSSQEYNNPVLIGYQGIGITLGLLPIVLCLSGLIKKKISPFQGFSEGWKDNSGPAKLGHAILGALRAFHTPYAHNRIGRSFTLDTLAAAVRTFLGWDTSMGYMVFAGINTAFTNPTATMMAPEIGGQGWSIGALKSALDNPESVNRASEVIDFFTKNFARMSLAFPVEPHAGRDLTYPLVGIQRVINQPKFPQLPEGHSLALLQQTLMGKYENKLSVEHVDQLLGIVTNWIQSPGQEAIKRAIISVLYLSRTSDVHGQGNQSFFDENPHVMDVLALNPSKITSSGDKRRIQQRSSVRGFFRKVFGGKTYRDQVDARRMAVQESQSLLNAPSEGGRPLYSMPGQKNEIVPQASAPSRISNSTGTPLGGKSPVFPEIAS